MPKSAGEARPMSKREQQEQDRLTGEGGTLTAANVTSHEAKYGPAWTKEQVQEVWADLDANLAQDRWQLFLGRQAFRDYLLSIGLTEIARSLQNCSSCVDRAQKTTAAAMDYATRRFSSAAASSSEQSSKPKQKARPVGKTSPQATTQEVQLAAMVPNNQPKVSSAKPSQSSAMSSPSGKAAAAPKPTSAKKHTPPVPTFQSASSTTLRPSVPISPPPPSPFTDQSRGQGDQEAAAAATGSDDERPLRYFPSEVHTHTYFLIKNHL